MPHCLSPTSKFGNMTDKLLTPPIEMVLDWNFNDFEAFAEAVHGWDIDFRQIDQGRFQAKLTHVITPSTILAHCSFNRKLEQTGAPPLGYRTVAIPADDLLDIRWRGKRVHSDHLLIFPQGAELDSVSNPGFSVFAFSISETRLSEAAHQRGLSSIDALFPRTDVIKCPRPTALALRRFASQLSTSAATRPRLLNTPSFRDSLESELVDLVLNAVATESGAPRPPSPARLRTRALKKALDIIADRASDPVTVTELEHLSGASGRTLRYAFEEAYGLSPKQYLQAYRLNQVRRELNCSTPRLSGAVSDTANAWGFWHMGQFAKDYRRLFHELPSETLAK